MVLGVVVAQMILLTDYDGDGLIDIFLERPDLSRVPGIGDAAGKTNHMQSGWMIQTDGTLKLNTPFSGFTR